MNQKQLSLFIRHAFSLTNAEKAAVKGANPAFANAMTQIRRLVEGLPEEALLQDKAWKRLRPQVMQALQPYNDSFRESIIDSLEGISKEVEENVVKSLEAIKAPAPIGTSGPIRNAPTGQLQAFGNRILAENVQSALSKTSIANVKLEKLFRVNPELDTPTSLWMKQNFQTIDRTVRTGILQGASTESIAKEISEEMDKRGLLKATKDTATGKIKAQANTVARTAIQSFNRQITEQVWDANADALEGLVYEWTSALDSRVCPTCGPLDGQKKPERGDLPETPIHPNCRCNVVVVDPDEDDDVRTAIQLSETKPTGKGSYASKVRVNGKLFYRQAVEIKPKGASYADYLADMAKKSQDKNLSPADQKSAGVTLAEYFGGGGKKGQGESTLGVERADWFKQAVKKGFPPDDALRRLVTDPDRITKLRSFKTEWDRGIDPPKPKAPKPKPKPPAPKPKPVEPKPKPATPKEVKQSERVLRPGPKNELVFQKQGGTAKMFDDSFKLLEEAEGEVGENVRKMRRFMEKQEIVMHPAIPETFTNGERFKGNQALLRAQRKAVEVLEKQGNDPGALNGARSLLKAIEAGDMTELKHVMGKASGAAGYTTRSSGIVNAAMTPSSTTFNKNRIKAIIESAEDSLKRENAYIDFYKPGGRVPGQTAPKGPWTADGLGDGALGPDNWLPTSIHEVGHQVHFRGLAGTKLANKYKGLKGERFVSRYSHQNEREQFAEAFVQYVLNPSGLKASHPRLYQWVNDGLEEALK